MENVEKLCFSENWNNKLFCEAFTSIRVHNPKKFAVGNVFEINYKHTFFYAKVVSVKKFKLHEMNDFMAMVDTGYSLKETIEIIKKMYKNYNFDYDTQYFDYILFQKIDIKKEAKNGS